MNHKRQKPLSTIQHLFLHKNAPVVSQWVLAGFAALALVVSIVAAIDSHKSAATADKSAGIAEKALELDQRPFLIPSSFRQCRAGSPGSCGNSYTMISIRGFGHTPAFDVKVRIGCGLATRYGQPPAQFIPSFKDRIAPGVFYPDDKTTISCEAAGASEFAFAVAGEITYKDIFRKAHTTRFCMTDNGDLLLQLPPSPPETARLVQLTACAEGNSVD